MQILKLLLIVAVTVRRYRQTGTGILKISVEAREFSRDSCRYRVLVQGAVQPIYEFSRLELRTLDELPLNCRDSENFLAFLHHVDATSGFGTFEMVFSIEKSKFYCYEAQTIRKKVLVAIST